MDIESIKQLIRNGDFPQAHDQLRQILSRTPDDMVAQMLYGTCCQIMGDSGTFGQIYQRLAPEMERNVKRGERSERTTMWIKYAAMFAMIFTFGFNAACAQEYPAPPGKDDRAWRRPSLFAPSREGQEGKGESGLYQRVLTMSLKEKFRYFLQRQDVKDRLKRGEMRVVVIPLQSPEEGGRQENLLLIRTKGNLKNDTDVTKVLRAISKENPQRNRGFAAGIDDVDGDLGGDADKTRRDSSLFVVFSPFERNSWTDGGTTKTSGLWRLKRFGRLEELDFGTRQGVERAIQCVVEHGDMSDLLLSSDEPGYLVLGVCFINIHGGSARTVYGGPRDYGDRFPKLVMTPQGKAVYELTEEMVRKQMEEARKRWEGILERPSQPESSPEPIHTKYGGPSFDF